MARLSNFLNKPLTMSPQARSALVQHLLQQSASSPQGIVSPAGTANKALQGLLMRRANIADRKENELTGSRQQALAGALSRAGQEGAPGEAAKRAALIISGGLPNDPMAKALLGSQAESIFAPQKGETGVPGSLQELAAINTDRTSRGESPMKPEEYLSQRRGSSADSQLYAQYVQSLPPEANPLPIDEFLVKFRGLVSGSQQTAEESAKTEAIPEQVGARTQAERFSLQIDEGYRAADALPIVNRGLELLDSIKTGGFQAVKLSATNLLGITGADEAELSANLGKAVLSQLRATFGAQFTASEGARLQEIEAGFGKSTEGNRRLLDQARKLVERVAERGINAAVQTNNTYDAGEIRKAMNLKLSIGASQGSGGLPDVTTMSDEELRRLAGGQ